MPPIVYLLTISSSSLRFVNCSQTKYTYIQQTGRGQSKAGELKMPNPRREMME